MTPVCIMRLSLAAFSSLIGALALTPPGSGTDSLRADWVRRMELADLALKLAHCAAGGGRRHLALPPPTR
jgi:hypothetical protein